MLRKIIRFLIYLLPISDHLGFIVSEDEDYHYFQDSNGEYRLEKESKLSVHKYDKDDDA